MQKREREKIWVLIKNRHRRKETEAWFSCWYGDQLQDCAQAMWDESLQDALLCSPSLAGDYVYRRRRQRRPSDWGVWSNVCCILWTSNAGILRRHPHGLYTKPKQEPKHKASEYEQSSSSSSYNILSREGERLRSDVLGVLKKLWTQGSIYIWVVCFVVALKRNLIVIWMAYINYLRATLKKICTTLAMFGCRYSGPGLAPSSSHFF